MSNKRDGTLHQSVASGDHPAVSAFLDQGQDVNALDAFGLTALTPSVLWQRWVILGRHCILLPSIIVLNVRVYSLRQKPTLIRKTTSVKHRCS